MPDMTFSFEHLSRVLLDPDSTRQLAQRCEQIRQEALERLREAGCPDDLMREAEAACLKHQRELGLILAAHAERLEAWQEYRPDVFETLRHAFDT